MKEDALYETYAAYLENLHSSGKIGKGEMSLMLISISEFNRFKKRAERSENFKAEVTRVARDKKISGLIDEED